MKELTMKELESKYKQATTFIDEVAAQLSEEVAARKHALAIANKTLADANKLLAIYDRSKNKTVDFQHKLALNDSLNAIDDARKAERACKHAKMQVSLVFDFWEEFNESDFDQKMNPS